MMTLNKVFVFEDLTNYLSELANCLWKLDEENKPTNDIADEPSTTYALVPDIF